MKILKVSLIKIDTVGTYGNKRFTVLFEDGSTLSKLEDYKSYKNYQKHGWNCSCYLTQVSKETGNLDSIKNSYLIFDTTRNGNYINLSNNYSCSEILGKIKQVAQEKKYKELDDYYFDVCQFFQNNKQSDLYKIGNMIITKAFGKTILYNVKDHTEDIINPFNIEKIYEKYFEDLKIRHTNYDNDVISSINIRGGKIIESYNWYREKHMKFERQNKTHELVSTGMKITDAIELSKKLKSNI